jgi:hypothetical protein
MAAAIVVLVLFGGLLMWTAIGDAIWLVLSIREWIVDARIERRWRREMRLKDAVRASSQGTPRG